MILFSEIMGKDVDFKKFRAEVGSRRDLDATFKNPERKKSGTKPSSSTDPTTNPTPIMVVPGVICLEGSSYAPLKNNPTPSTSSSSIKIPTSGVISQTGDRP